MISVDDEFLGTFHPFVPPTVGEFFKKQFNKAIAAWLKREAEKIHSNRPELGWVRMPPDQVLHIALLRVADALEDTLP
jgi:hypothetical protein